MAASKKVVEVDLHHERDTKGTHVFSTTATDAKITNIYVKKGTFEGDQAPATVTLTVTA